MINGFWQKRLFEQVKLACLLSVMLHGVFLVTNWYVVSPIGYGGKLLILFVPYLMFPLIISGLVVPIAICLLLVKRLRRDAVTIIVCGTLFVLVGFPLGRLAYLIRIAAFEKLAERSAPLIMAIGKYETQYGRPPHELVELVPQFIDRVPTTGMPAYPQYKYATDNPNDWSGNPWVLYIETSSGMLNWDRFMYFPLQNYPEVGYGGWLRRVGNWAYLHE